jgi:hypothetical protein
MNPNLGRQWDAKGYSDIADSDEINANRSRVLGALQEYHHDWEREPVRRLDPNSVKLTQTAVWKDSYDRVSSAKPEDLPPAEVVRFKNGDHVLRDGHHRWAVAHDRGELLSAHVYRAKGAWSS